MTIQCIFPVELIFLILYHTDPRDIVRWQTVSKWFRTVVNDALLWKALYANASFPRPPGPFPAQSTGFLQRTLIKSAQLVQSWTTRPMRGLSDTQVCPGGPWCSPPKLICGRWLVSRESKRQIVLHDAGAEAHARQVLWGVEKPVVSSWDMCWMTSVEGRCVVYVVLQFSNKYREGNSSSWQLLEFRLNDRSGELYDSSAMDLPESMSLNGRVESPSLRGGKSPFLFIHAASVCMVFDTRTRVFYKLPKFHIALDKTRREARGYMLRDRMAFTDTHLVSFRYLQDHLDYITVIQVFTVLPDGSPGENGNSTLCLTHEGLLDFEVRNVEALRPSVDPVTGTTTVRLLDYAVREYDPQVTRLDLTLPEPSAVDVLPMTIKMQHVDFPNDGAHATCRRAASLYVDVSDNGQVRGFIRQPPQLTYRGAITYDRIMKFTIDTTHDPWVTSCGKLSPPEWHYIGDVWERRIIEFDGMRGKVCVADLKNKTFVIDIE